MEEEQPVGLAIGQLAREHDRLGIERQVVARDVDVLELGAGPVAAQAASVFTVTRTNSEPARAKAAVCRTVPATSTVSVLVID